MHERLSFQNGCIGTCSAPVFGKALLCVWEEQGIDMVEQEPLGLSVVFPVLELSIHFIIHALMLLSGTLQKVHPYPPQLCPVVD